MKKYLVGLSIALLSAAAWALPSVQDVQAQVQQGHYSQAESMMKEVLDAKPDSAKGHYIYAELLAHNGNFSKASAEAAKAKELDPSIKFADPEKFRAFQALLQREQSPPSRTESSSSLSNLGSSVAPAPAPARSPGVPSWVWGVGLAAVAWLLWRGFSRSRGTAAPTAGPSYGAANGGPGYGVPGGTMQPNPYGTPYGAPAAPAAGGGLLRTGAAVAGGVAAGMLVDQLINRHEGGLGGLGGGGGRDDLSSLQNPMFGPQNDSAANELENRNIDFGNGGDWDAGGGSSDVGGGDTGGGWD